MDMASVESDEEHQEMIKQIALVGKLWTASTDYLLLKTYMKSIYKYWKSHFGVGTIM